MQIETDAGHSMRFTPKGATESLPDYAAVMGLLVGVVIAWLMVFVVLGPEAHGSHFEHAKVATQADAGLAVTTEFVKRRESFDGKEKQEHAEEKV